MPESSSILGISLLPQPGEPISATRGPLQARTAVEQALVEIWQQVMPDQVIGPAMDFFSLGGDSLLATQILTRVRQVFEVELGVAELLDRPSVGGMAALVELALRNGRGWPGPALNPVSRAEPLPLSFTQERMWFIHQMDPQSAAYNIDSAVRLRGAFDLPALAAALTELARRHETLRTTFSVVNGEPRQRAHAPAPFHVEVVEASSLAEAYALAGQATQQPFDLARGPLLRATAIRLGPEDHVLLLHMHHIISDAWSLGVLGRELIALYRAARQGGPVRLPELPIQYADFAVWQRAMMRGEVLENELGYWRAKLSGVTALELPLDRPRPSTQTYRGALETAELEPGVLRGLQRIGQQSGSTLSMVMLAAFQVLLGRYSGQDDIAVGLTIANRREVELEGLIGAFVNTLVLRTNLAGAANFSELLAQVRQNSLEAYAHQDMPFAKLVAELNPERNLSHTPLVQVMFNYINTPMPSTNLGGLESEDVELDRGAAQFDLTLIVIDSAQRKRLQLEYNTDLFEPATARRMLGHYIHLLAAISADPSQPLAGLALMDEAEQRRLLVEWNNTERPCPAADLAELFEAQAARTPAAPALILAGDTLTYDALNCRANRIAHLLQSLGVRPGALVGLCLKRSFEQMAALLAVLKAGAAYVPLDPAYPTARLRDMLADCAAAVVLTDVTLLDPILNRPVEAGTNGGASGRDGAYSVIALDTLAERLEAQSDANLGLRVPPDNPAYVIYTSGSTGRPKGVVAHQRGAVNRAQWMWDTYPFEAGEVACHKTSLSFVDSVAEIFVPLLQGVPLVLIPDEVAKDPARLAETLAARGVTRLVLVPSLLRALLALRGELGARLPRLALVVTAGELLDPALARACARALPGATLLNLYGSSEDGGDVTCFDCHAPLPDGAVPIGKPIANTQIYVLDAHGQPVPVGVTGEIYAGGAGVALGYYNRPELNAERFVPNPFCDAPGARLFRTGDLARFLPDGNLLFLGRRDRQVKVRGVRIELDEVQTGLAQHPQVAACAVRAHERGSSAGAELAAYYVPKPGASLTTGELRRHLAGRLPESMLPAWFVWLEALPLLPNGKVDLTALPNPDPAAYRRHAGQRVAPRTLLEASLARLWAECLDVPAVGLSDNFFELGGHSLLAASLFARIEATLGLDLPLALLFQSPTVGELAAAIAQGGQAPARLTSLVSLKPSGTRPPLFCVHPLGGGVGDYTALAVHLHPQQPFYGLRAKGLEDETQQCRSVDELAADYLAEIRTIQPGGPYRLGGYSSGGLIAFEMARQLTAAGERVALVALLDAYAPRAPGPARLRPRALVNMAANLPRWLNDLSHLEREQILTRVRRWRLEARHGGGALTAADFFGESELAKIPERHRRFVENHFKAILTFAPQPYPGSVTLFRAQAQALSRAGDPDKGWRALALGGVEIRDFPGSHRTLLTEPWVGELAKVVQKKLDEIGNE